MGFALSSRGEAIAERASEAATRHSWEATVSRTETQLATLGTHRPSDVIRAELAASPVPSHIWRRTRHCLDLSLEESRLACAPVQGLRKELAAAEAAEQLEAQLVARRAQLTAIPVAGSFADPQATGLARLTGLDETTVRTGVALLLATVIEAGSALGFTLVALATGRNPPPPAAKRAPRNPPPPAPRRVAGMPKATSRDGNTQHRAPAGSLERWVAARLRVEAAGSIPAREAYDDFRRWARAEGIEPCTETRFAREFSVRITKLGGAKVKRRDRAYYIGAALVAPKIVLKAAA
jgi:hypothetical protein